VLDAVRSQDSGHDGFVAAEAAIEDDSLDE
jgi:hypothetical protein